MSRSSSSSDSDIGDVFDIDGDIDIDIICEYLERCLKLLNSGRSDKETRHRLFKVILNRAFMNYVLKEGRILGRLNLQALFFTCYSKFHLELLEDTSLFVNLELLSVELKCHHVSFDRYRGINDKIYDFMLHNQSHLSRKLSTLLKASPGFLSKDKILLILEDEIFNGTISRSAWSTTERDCKSDVAKWHPRDRYHLSCMICVDILYGLIVCNIDYCYGLILDQIIESNGQKDAYELFTYLTSNYGSDGTDSSEGTDSTDYLEHVPEPLTSSITKWAFGLFRSIDDPTSSDAWVRDHLAEPDGYEHMLLYNNLWNAFKNYTLFSDSARHGHHELWVMLHEHKSKLVTRLLVLPDRTRTETFYTLTEQENAKEEKQRLAAIQRERADRSRNIFSSIFD